MKILYGAGNVGRMAINRYGKENVRLVIDNHINQDSLDGIRIVRFKDYLDNERLDDDEIIVSVFYDNNKEILESLEQNDISYEIYGSFEEEKGCGDCIHIFGEYPNIRITAEKEVLDRRTVCHRAFLAEELFQTVLKKYKDDFEGKTLELFIHTGDNPIAAYDTMKRMKLNHIFGYSTVDVYKDRVIPIPDYRSFYMDEAYYFKENMKVSVEASEKDITDNRIFWRGSTSTNEGRKWLKTLSEKYPDILKVEEYDNKNYIPMYAHTDYKYAIDVRGFGFTDRVCNLLWLNRPLFLVDRPYKQWFFDKLVPMVNYIPVKEDLSDLIEKYEYMETHPQLYDAMRKSMRELCEKELSPEAVLRYVKDIILKYGVKR